MTERRTIGNMLAPPRFLAFLATLLIGVPVATVQFNDLALGAMAPISAAIEEWRRNVATGGRSTDAEQLLRQRLWDPIEAVLARGATSHVLISPDASLGLLAWGALPGRAPGQYLIEDWPVSVVPVPQLLPEMLKPPAGRSAASLLAVGAVNYDRGAAKPSGAGGKQGMPNVRPLRDRVLVKRVEEEEQKVGGIIIPDTAKEKPQQAEVVAVGSGRILDNGQREPLAVKAGDKVLVGKWSGTDVKIDGTDYLIVKEDEILGILS